MASQRRRLAEAPGTEPSSTIVIVDDDRDKRAALRAMLAPLGQRIVEAHSGQAALRAVADPAAATILFDVRMAQELHSSIESVATLSAALRDSELRTKALLDNVADGIFILDETGSIQLANRAASRLFGYRTEDLVGKPITLMLAPQCEADVSLLALVGPELARTPGAPAQTIETLGRRRDGSSFAMEIVCAMIRRGGRHLKLLCIRDVSERIAHTAALQQQASHDALTGLANRSLFSEYVARALADADTAGVEQQRAVLMVAFDESLPETVSCGRELLALDTALEELSRMNPRQATMVETRFFGGFDVTETADLLNVSEATVMRDWRAAKAWLAHQLRRAG